MRHPWSFAALEGGRVWTQAQPATSGQEPPAVLQARDAREGRQGSVTGSCGC